MRRCALVVVFALGLAGCAAAAAPPRAAVTTPIRPASAAGTTSPTATSAPVTTTTTAAPTTTTTAAGTAQIVFQPFSGTAVAPGLTVTGSDTGHCLPYTRQSGGRTYYRCFGVDVIDGHTTIYDPCFAGPKGIFAPLACPSMTSLSDLVMFKATSVDAPEPPGSVDEPWAIQLVDGQLCRFVSAAWSGLGPYGCQAPAGAGVEADCHAPSSGQPWWEAPCQFEENAQTPFVDVQVTKVWF